jgi:hypothetical protein
MGPKTWARIQSGHVIVIEGRSRSTGEPEPWEFFFILGSWIIRGIFCLRVIVGFFSLFVYSTIVSQDRHRGNEYNEFGVWPRGETMGVFCVCF